MSSLQQDNGSSGNLSSAGLDVFGTHNSSSSIKKNKGIISRMKRSLSTSSGGRSPQPLPLKLPPSSSLLLQTSSSPGWSTSGNYTTTPYSPIATHGLRSPAFMPVTTTTPTELPPQRAFSPIPGNLSSPIPKASNSITHYFGASPIVHLNYETFASSSTSNLSIQSFPATTTFYDGERSIPTRRSFDTSTNHHQSNIVITNNKRSTTLPNSHSLSVISSNGKSPQQINKSTTTMLEIGSNSSTTTITKKNRKQRHEEEAEEDQEDIGQIAPAPAMYWSCPDVFGKIKPPSLRAHASVVFGDKMYVFGGTTKTTCSDTLYIMELDTSTWTRPHVYGTLPPACRAHSLSVDESNGKIYLFGGGDGQKYYNHLYIFDTYTMNWSQPKTQGIKPSERRAHISVMYKGSLYIFGGGDGTRALNDTHRLNLKTKEWNLIKTTGDKPTRRGYHTGTLVSDKLIIYGGSDGKECFGGIHVLDLETETWHTIHHMEQQIPRLSHSAICIGSFLFVIAGHDGNKYCNDLLMLNLVNMQWETRSIYGQTPSIRGYHTTILYDSRIYLFGGFNGSIFSNQTFLLDLSSYSYLPQIVNFSIDL